MKALCVFSGGLDSMLAAELIRVQGIDVLALFFETPFFSSKRARKSARSMGLPLRVVNITSRHLEVVKTPKHGYGSNMNPCIDCHALMFKIAGEILAEERADFVLTGEVLGQRPMSQNMKSLSLVSSESGLGGLLLRPLSAKHLSMTIPEEKMWVKRELLKDFQGRSRKPQIALAKRFNLIEYPSPAGGCILTEKIFSRRLRDLFSVKSDLEPRQIELLKLGRHFRIASGTKVVLGRNKEENEEILALSGDENYILTPVSVPGPTAHISGVFSQSLFELTASITASYSNAEISDKTPIKVIGKGEEKILMARVCDKKEFRRYMI